MNMLTVCRICRTYIELHSEEELRICLERAVRAGHGIGGVNDASCKE